MGISTRETLQGSDSSDLNLICTRGGGSDATIDVIGQRIQYTGRRPLFESPMCTSCRISDHCSHCYIPSTVVLSHYATPTR